MLISRNTCKTRRPLPSLSRTTSARFPLEDPVVVLEASWGRGPRLHSTAKKRSKGASSEEISTLLHARELAVCGTKTRVRVGGGGKGAPPTRARLFRVPLGRRRERKRDQGTRVKPSSLIGNPLLARRRKENGVVSALVNPSSLSLCLSRHGCSSRRGNEFGGRDGFEASMRLLEGS